MSKELGRRSGQDAGRRTELLPRLMAAGRAMSTATVLYHSAVAEAIGLSATEDKAVDLLDRLGPLTAGELAERSGLKPATITGLVDRLERKGFVRRVRHPVDGRRVLVEPVPARIAAVTPRLSSLVDTLNDVFTRYSDDELELLLGFLTEVTERQQSITAQLTRKR